MPASGDDYDQYSQVPISVANHVLDSRPGTPPPSLSRHDSTSSSNTEVYADQRSSAGASPHGDSSRAATPKHLDRGGARASSPSFGEGIAEKAPAARPAAGKADGGKGKSVGSPQPLSPKAQVGEQEKPSAESLRHEDSGQSKKSAAVLKEAPSRPAGTTNNADSSSKEESVTEQAKESKAQAKESKSEKPWTFLRDEPSARRKAHTGTESSTDSGGPKLGQTSSEPTISEAKPGPSDARRPSSRTKKPFEKDMKAKAPDQEVTSLRKDDSAGKQEVTSAETSKEQKKLEKEPSLAASESSQKVKPKKLEHASSVATEESARHESDVAPSGGRSRLPATTKKQKQKLRRLREQRQRQEKEASQAARQAQPVRTPGPTAQGRPSHAAPAEEFRRVQRAQRAQALVSIPLLACAGYLVAKDCLRHFNSMREHHAERTAVKQNAALSERVKFQAGLQRDGAMWVHDPRRGLVPAVPKGRSVQGWSLEGAKAHLRGELMLSGTPVSDEELKAERASRRKERGRGK